MSMMDDHEKKLRRNAAQARIEDLEAEINKLQTERNQLIAKMQRDEI